MSAYKSDDTIPKPPPRNPSKSWARTFALMIFLGSTGCSGCSRPPVIARFNQGFFFTSWRGSEYQEVAWHRKEIVVGGRGVPDPADPCPIVIHLQGVDLDEKKLVDVKALKALGFTQPQDAFSRMSYRGKNYSIGVTLCNGVLAGVSVIQDRDSQEKLEGILSINGQKLSLPVSEEDLLRVLGKPKSKVKAWG